MKMNFIIDIIHYFILFNFIIQINCFEIDEEPLAATEESGEILGAAITQISRHPYIASVQGNDTYLCSAVILNSYWLLTVTKCFDPKMVKSYATYYHLNNYTIRVGSSYNNKVGVIYKLRMMMHNSEVRVSALKVHGQMKFGPLVQPVNLPGEHDRVLLGYLVSIVAWTPSGHIRLVNAPAIESSICESYTKLKFGQFLCIGGVQDPDRHFCRKDNGGAIIQNNTLVGITNFVLECANYAKVHAFPSIAPVLSWLDSTIWDEEDRPTTPMPPNITTELPEYMTTVSTYEDNRRKFLLSLPYNPVNVPLVPGSNSVMAKMSLYESYLENKRQHEASKDAVKPNWAKEYGPYPKKYSLTYP